MDVTKPYKLFRKGRQGARILRVSKNRRIFTGTGHLLKGTGLTSTPAPLPTGDTLTSSVVFRCGPGGGRLEGVGKTKKQKTKKRQRPIYFLFLLFLLPPPDHPQDDSGKPSGAGGRRRQCCLCSLCPPLRKYLLCLPQRKTSLWSPQRTSSQWPPQTENLHCGIHRANLDYGTHRQSLLWPPKRTRGQNKTQQNKTLQVFQDVSFSAFCHPTRPRGRP